MKVFLLTLLMAANFGSLTASAVDTAAQVDKSGGRSTGDIDMNQFKNLENPDNPEKVRDSKIKIQMTCTDPQGHLIKKGETGFDTCLANTQTPIINKPRTPEPTNDPRSY